jgi:hypothetical protein
MVIIRTHKAQNPLTTANYHQPTKQPALLIMLFLYDAHEINAYRAGHACLSVRMVQLENCLTDLDEILYERLAIGIYSKVVLLNFLQSVVI